MAAFVSKQKYPQLKSSKILELRNNLKNKNTRTTSTVFVVNFYKNWTAQRSETHVHGLVRNNSKYIIILLACNGIVSRANYGKTCTGELF